MEHLKCLLCKTSLTILIIEHILPWPYLHSSHNVESFVAITWIWIWSKTECCVLGISITIEKSKKKSLQPDFLWGIPDCLIILSLLGVFNTSSTKWPPFHRWYFRVHFGEWKVFYFDWNFTEVCYICGTSRRWVKGKKMYELLNLTTPESSMLHNFILQSMDKIFLWISKVPFRG